MNKNPVDSEAMLGWLDKQILTYASGKAVGGVIAKLEFDVSRNKWTVIAASNILYEGKDEVEAARIFNENSY